MKMFLDPWPPDFDPPVAIDQALYDGPVDTTVETSKWEAIANPQQRLFGKIFFLDGARRIDARVLVQTADGRTVHGLFGTIAAGCVESEGMRANVRAVDIQRRLILGGGISDSATIDIGGGRFSYQAFATQAENPQDVLAKLQYLMRENEAQLGQTLLAEGSCVFVDGPLTYFSSSCESMVGVVKKIQQPYLDPLHFDLVSRLATGQRTPLFHIPDPKHEHSQAGGSCRAGGGCRRSSGGFCRPRTAPLRFHIGARSKSATKPGSHRGARIRNASPDG
jgi:hypothetical protein